nr:hypothetical protein [Tanacetum cinerariifolium]
MVDLLHLEEMLKELRDESKVLLKVPRNNSMYSFDLKNVVPVGGPKSSEDEVADDVGKKSTKVPRKENGVQDPAKKDPGRERAQRNEFKGMFGQDKDANGNSTYRMFTLVSAAGSFYDTEIFSGTYDDEVEGIVADFNSLELTTVFSPIPTTRIHKDHPKEKIIRDPLLAP